MTVASRVAVLAVALVAISGERALAETPADAAFARGRDLFKKGEYETACAEFENSQRLDPQIGTQFNIGQCSEKLQKYATAAAAYREVVAKDTNAARRAAAEQHLADVIKKVSLVVVTVEAPPPGLVISLNSKAGERAIEANKNIEVDPGDYTIVARARGYNEVINKVTITVKDRLTAVEATLVPGAANSEVVRPPDPTSTGESDEVDAAPVTPPRSRRKLIAIGALAAGGGAVIGGLVFGHLARTSWDDAKAVCGGTTCSSADDLARATSLADRARSRATLSTALAVGGGVFVAAGVVLWLTAPSGAVQVAPTADDTGAGVSVSGRF